MNITVVNVTEIPQKGTFNLDPGMEMYGIILLLVFYTILCLGILSLNYLILRAFMRTRALLPRQRIFLSFLASIEFSVGLVSMPAFMYNMLYWPSYMYFIYEAFDCASGFATGLILVILSIKVLRATFRAPTRYAGHPRRRNLYFVVVGSIVTAASVSALNMTCLMNYLSFSFFFFSAGGLLSVFVLAIGVTCTVTTVTIVIGKESDNEQDEDRKFRKLVLMSCAVYIFTWALPYTLFIFNSFCGFCLPLPPMFFYIVRLFLYLRSFLIPITYFRSNPLFYKVVRKILTRDCLGKHFRY